LALAAAGAGAATTGATAASTDFVTFLETDFAAAGADIIPGAVEVFMARIRTFSEHEHSILVQRL